MPHIAFVQMHSISWQSSDCYDYNNYQLIKHISKWQEISDEDLAELQKYWHQTNEARVYHLIIQGDAETILKDFKINVDAIIKKGQREEARRKKEAEAWKKKQEADAEKKKQRRAEKLRKELAQLEAEAAAATAK